MPRKANEVYLLLALIFAFALVPNSSGVAGVVGTQERQFFGSVERPEIKARQNLGNWFVSAETVLWPSALGVLSDKAASKLASADDCEMAMWAAARNKAWDEALTRNFMSWVSTLMTAGLAPALSAFSIPGKILIAETLTLSIRLFNQYTFGVLETKDIPDEVVRTLLNITIGYTAPLLTDDYLSGKLTEIASRAGINSVLEREQSVVSRAEGSNLGSRNFSPKHGLPLVNVNVLLVYSPYTHFVTLFIRGVGEGCPANQLFILQYEVDKDGLLVKGTLKDRVPVDLKNYKSDVVSIPPSTGTSPQQWFDLKPGEEKYDFRLNQDGTLSYQRQPFMPKLRVHEGQGKTYYTPPKSIISPLSHSGSYAFIKACDKSGYSAFCWFFYLLDVKKGRITPTFAGKYGPIDWIKWSPDERYAILAYGHAGSTWLYRIHLNTGKSDEISMWDIAKSQGRRKCPQVYLRVDLNSFAWHGHDKFRTNVNIWCAHNYGTQAKLARSHKLEVNVPTLAIRIVTAGPAKR